MERISRAARSDASGRRAAFVERSRQRRIKQMRKRGLGPPQKPVMIVRPEGNGVPPVMRTKLKYVWRTSTAAIPLQSNVFRLNSLYDPDYTGVGAQPRYFDQLIALYGAYVVTGCKARVTYCGFGAATHPPLSCAISMSNVNDRGSIAAYLLGELPNSKKALSPVGAPPVVLSMYKSTAELYGVPKVAVLSDDKFWGTSGTNPTNVTWLTCNWQPADESTSMGASVQVEFTMYVTFKQRTTIAQS